jgi:hypothetical protein
VEERITGEQGPQRAFFHERYWRYMAAKKPVPLNVYLRLKHALYLLEQVKCLAAGHAPLLLLDGGAESTSTHRFLRLLHERLPPPCEYHTIPGADHFCNTAALGPILVYDSAVINYLADYLVLWTTAPQGLKASYEQKTRD